LVRDGRNAPGRIPAWPRELFFSWVARWLSVYSLAQFVGLLVALALVWWLGSPGSPNGQEIITSDVISRDLGPVMQLYLFEGGISILALWTFGRRRRPTGFRVLSLIVLIPLWMPLQLIAAGSPFLVLTWLVASTIAAIAVRQPEPSYYGPRQ
jgi:hypothetical protein